MSAGCVLRLDAYGHAYDIELRFEGAGQAESQSGAGGSAAADRRGGEGGEGGELADATGWARAQTLLERSVAAFADETGSANLNVRYTSIVLIELNGEGGTAPGTWTPTPFTLTMPRESSFCAFSTRSAPPFTRGHHHKLRHGCTPAFFASATPRAKAPL